MMNGTHGKNTFLIMILTTSLLFSIGNGAYVGGEAPARSIYIDHSPISIEGDTELLNTAVAESWPGSGSQLDPYIISSYSINGTGSDHCIEIEDTTLHLVIRNNLLLNSEFGDGLSLDSCSNITISNNTVRDSYGPWNVNVNLCSSIRITDNTIEGDLCQYGLRVKDSKNIVVSSNQISDSMSNGIYVSGSNFIRIVDNKVKGIGGSGMAFSTSADILIQGNLVSNCTAPGINCYFTSSSITLYDNELVGNGFALGTLDTVVITSNNTVDNVPVRQYFDQDLTGVTIPVHTSQFFLNNVTNFHLTGMDHSMGYALLRAYDSQGVHIDNCTFADDPDLFYISKCDDVSIMDSSFHNQTGTTITMFYGTGATIRGNVFVYVPKASFISQTADVTVDDNQASITEVGFTMVQTKGTTFTNNTVTSIGDAIHGISLTIPERLVLSGNFVSGFRMNGVFLSSPRMGIVNDNKILGNGSTTSSKGLNVSSPSNLTVMNNIIRGHGMGLDLSYTSVDSSFTSNIIEDNIGSGIRLRVAEDHIVDGNLIFNNSGYGIESVNSSGNKIIDNTFINNYGSDDSFSSLNIQATDNGNKNIWNDMNGGNYWRDWDSPDGTGDGIVDLPYLIFGTTSYDQKPLAEPSYTYLSEPINFSAHAIKDRIFLEWELPGIDLDGSFEGFKLFRTGGEGPDLRIDLGPIIFHYNDENVTDGTTYVYHLKGINRYGEGRSTALLGAIPDSTSPEIGFLSPANGSVISSREVQVTWNVTDNVEVLNVEISTDGVDWQDMGSNSSYLASNLTDGQQTIILRAVDAQGNNATSSLIFTVDTSSPNLEVLSPDNGTITTQPTIDVQWEGEDEITDVKGYRTKVDEGDWQDQGLNTSANISLSSEGIHTIVVQAEDMAGNTEIVSIEVLLDRTGPEVFFTFPADGYNTTDTTFDVKWAGYDTLSGISRFELSVDGGTPLGLSSMVTGFTLTSLSLGEHSVVLIAMDGAGNEKEIEVSFRIIDDDQEPSTTLIRGRVLDADGEPVHKAMVKADTGDYTYTDSRGYFVVEVARGQRNLNIEKSGYVSIDINVNASSSEDITVDDIILEKRTDDDDGNIGTSLRESRFCQVCCLLIIGIPLLLMLLGLLTRAIRRSRRKRSERKNKKIREENLKDEE